VDDVEEGAELVHRVQLARERAGEVEPEAVHVHLGDPVAQAVHDQLQHARAAHVQRVAAAGEVLVVARRLRPQAVVRRVVDSAQRDRRTGVIAFGGVVVDDVEDHFEAGGVQGAHHHLELAHAFERRRRRRVARVRREVGQGVVAPVVGEAALDQVPLVEVVVHRHQLHRRHAEREQVLHRGLRRQTQIRAAQMLGNAGVARRVALDVQLVDQRFVPRDAQRPVRAPRERRIDDGRERRVRRAVALVERVVSLAVPEPEQRFVPPHGAADDARVRIHDDLVGIEPVATARLVRSVHAVAIELSRPHVGQIAVPHHVGVLGQRNRDRFAVGRRRVEQAQLDAGRVLAEQREVDADAVPCRAERIRTSGPDAQRSIRHNIL
jgi:hypothetical protein